MYNFNAISFTGPEISSLYNKFKVSSIEQQNANEALAKTLAQSKNYIPGKTLGVGEYAVHPMDKSPMVNREQAREHLIKASDAVLDDIELYGLIVTNDLLKISRTQEIISKTDFSSDFIDFRKKIFKDIEKTGDQSIDIVKKMKDEFTAMIKMVNDNMRSKLRRNITANTTIEENFQSLKKIILAGIEQSEKRINAIAERIDAMYPYLIPPSLRGELEAAKKVYDYERRKERRKNIRVSRKYLAYINDRFNNSLLELKRLREQKLKIQEDRRKQDQIDLNEREKRKRIRLEEYQNTLNEAKALEYAEMEMKIKFINDTVTPFDEMIQLPFNANDDATRQKLREEFLRNVAIINEEEKKENQDRKNMAQQKKDDSNKLKPKNKTKKEVNSRQLSAPNDHL